MEEKSEVDYARNVIADMEFDEDERLELEGTYPRFSV